MTATADGRVGLEGRTALVTGGGQGIGLAVARLPDALGARVEVNHSDEPNLPRNLGEDFIGRPCRPR